MRHIVYIILLAAALSWVYLFFMQDKEVPPREQEQAEAIPAGQFTLDIAQSLAEETWGTCEDECDEMHVEHLMFEGTDRVIAVYEGLRDDSVRAERYEAQVMFDDESGEWAVGEVDILWRCWHGRGSQEWTDELCI